MNKNFLSAELPQGAKPSVIIASIRERQLFREFREKQSDFTIKHISKVEGFENWDVIYLSAGTEYLAEIKVRDKKLSSWDHEGWILEEYKFNELKKLQAKSKRPLVKVYINIFKDAVVIWNLDSINIEFFERDSKVMTTENKGRTIKSVAYLKSNQGTVYNQKNDIDKAQFVAIEMFKNLFPNSDI